LKFLEAVMRISRRALLRSGGTAIAAGVAFSRGARASEAAAGAIAQDASAGKLPAAFDSLKPIRDRVQPISADEYKGRVARAQELMGGAKPPYSALFVAPGTSLRYFTGVRWWPSERMLGLFIPQSGDPMFVCPGFEEARLRELLPWAMTVRVWQEDENPYKVAAKWMAEKHFGSGRIAVEETAPFVFFDGVRKAYPFPEYLSGTPISAGCRVHKSEHELALMRLACAATFDVYKATFASLREGMKESEVSDLVARGYEKMGLEGDAMVLFGPAASLPHGMHEDRALREGDGVMLDDGTSVEGYQSDVTRTSVLGKPSDKLRRAFDIVRKAQDAALAAAVAGKTCGAVDDAARAAITQGGFGPGYKFF
jgi:Xaa-Pro dipeptidase